MSTSKRRDFLQNAVVGGTGLGAARLLAGLLGRGHEALAAAAAKFKLGVGTYTFRGVDTDAELAHYRELGIRYIELSSPPFFLNNLDTKAIQPYIEKLRRAEVEMLSWYAGDIKTDAEIAKTMEAAKLFGVKHLSGSAEGDALLALDRACQKNGVQFGIHNHWFADREFAYQSPEDVLGAMAKTSRAIGATLDTGHMIACGHDPTEAFHKLKEYVRLIHLKDDDRPGHNVVLGEGKANIAKFLKAIIEAGFSRLVAIEYEEGTDPIEEVRACVDYVRARI